MESPELPPPLIPSFSAPPWSAILQKPPSQKPQQPISSRVFGGCSSSKGVSVAVVDANAIIHGDKTAAADRFVTVSEVLEEVRDPVSRQQLALPPPLRRYHGALPNLSRKLSSLQGKREICRPFQM